MKEFVEGYKEDKEEKKAENRKKMKFLEETAEMNKELIIKRERVVLAREKIAATLASQEARKKRDSDLLILKEEPDSIMDEERKNTIKKLQQHVIDYYK